MDTRLQIRFDQDQRKLLTQLTTFVHGGTRLGSLIFRIVGTERDSCWLTREEVEQMADDLREVVEDLSPRTGRSFWDGRVGGDHPYADDLTTLNSERLEQAYAAYEEVADIVLGFDLHYDELLARKGTA